MRAILALIAFAVFAQASGDDTSVRVEIGIDGDPQRLIDALRKEGYEAGIGVEAPDNDIEDAQGVWIGRMVPVETVKQIVLLSLERYPNLRYYKFFGADPSPAHWDRTVYVGGSKWAAHGNTKPLEAKTAIALFSNIKSPEQLRQLIESLRICTEEPNKSLQPTCEDARG